MKKCIFGFIFMILPDSRFDHSKFPNFIFLIKWCIGYENPIQNYLHHFSKRKDSFLDCGNNKKIHANIRFFTNKIRFKSCFVIVIFVISEIALFLRT